MAIDSVKVDLITAKFDRMLQDFAEIDPTVEFADIVRAIAVRVMAGAMRRTRAANIDKIKARHNSAEWTTLDGKHIKLSWYLRNDAEYRQLLAHRALTLKTKLDARGLAKQSWLRLGQKIASGPIDSPAYVDAANYAGQQYPQDVSFEESAAGMAFQLKVINASPIVQKADGEAALIYAMAGETRYFYTLLAKHAFLNASSRASKYPGVYVAPRLDPIAA